MCTYESEPCASTDCIGRTLRSCLGAIPRPCVAGQLWRCFGSCSTSPSSSTAAVGGHCSQGSFRSESCARRPCTCTYMPCGKLAAGAKLLGLVPGSSFSFAVSCCATSLTICKPLCGMCRSVSGQWTEGACTRPAGQAVWSVNVYIETIWCLLFAAFLAIGEDCHGEYVVSDAVASARFCNGDYHFAGQYEERPFYTKSVGVGFIYFWGTSGRWRLSDQNDTLVVTADYVPLGTATPPTEGDWVLSEMAGRPCVCKDEHPTSLCATSRRAKVTIS